MYTQKDVNKLNSLWDKVDSCHIRILKWSDDKNRGGIAWYKAHDALTKAQNDLERQQVRMNIQSCSVCDLWSSRDKDQLKVLAEEADMTVGPCERCGLPSLLEKE